MVNLLGKPAITSTAFLFFRGYFQALNRVDVDERRFETTRSTSAKAMETATTFHEKLRGNEDYIESRILLNVTDCSVTLVEFADSKTHIKVEVEDGKRPELVFVSGRFDWGK